MSTHTSGPWFANKGEAFNPERWGAIVAPWRDGEEVGEETIAEICTAPNGTDEADARLIAAAPDLLAALSELLGHIDNSLLVRNINGDNEPGWAMKMLPLVRTLAGAKAALAKAKGEA